MAMPVQNLSKLVKKIVTVHTVFRSRQIQRHAAYKMYLPAPEYELNL